jgi:hypothetical protein
MSTTMPMLAPDGTSGDIPLSNVKAAQAAGFKVAVEMQSPDGKNGYIPADQVHSAASSGFKMVPMDAPDAVKASYWDALTNPVGSGGQKQGLLGGALQVGGQAIKTAAQPFIHPLDTAAGALKGAAYAGGQAMGVQMPEDWNPVTPLVQNYIQDKQQGGNALALENLGGQAVGAYEGGRLAAPVAAAALKVAAPVASRVALLGKTPEGAYESALKPSTTLSMPERAAITQTGLQQGIPVSLAGAEKLGDLIDDLNQKTKAVIAADPNRPISMVPAVQNLEGVRSRLANQVTPQPDMAEIDQVQQNFLNNPKIQPQGEGPSPGSLPASEAQAMKQGTYQALGDKAYGELKGASIEAQKALARGIKDEIQTQFPEIGQLNAEQGKLLDLQPVLERAVGRIANHQMIGIGTPVVAGATEAVTGSSKLAAISAVYKAVFDNPAVKSRLAISISRAQQIPYPEALSRVNAYSASLGSLASAPQAYSSAGTPTPQAAPQQ